MQHLGVFGASFNPPTLGHQDVVRQSLEVFDKVLLVPSLSHPFGKLLAAASHRLAMLEMFVAQFSECHNRVSILNIEEDIQKKQTKRRFIYTYDVLLAIEQYYAKKAKACQIRFIVGPDNAKPAVWQTFYRHEEIEKRWPLFVAKESVFIHSTNVKEAIKRYSQEPMELKKALIQLVGEAIAEYILQNHLYNEVKKEQSYG